MRLGYFGGTFDPPHLGHLAVAQAAADAFRLDSILLVPTARQPLKPALPCASYADRLAMVSLLCAADPRLHASELEAPDSLLQPRPSYTVDTLERLHTLEPHARLFVIVGADAFRSLPQWKDPARLLDLAEWIVVTRPQLQLHHTLPHLDPPLTDAQRQRIHHLATVDHPAAASDIRHALQTHALPNTDTLSGLLPPGISDYIRGHHLYR